MKDLSYQLYSARSCPSWEPVLARLSALGYTQVEGFGGVYGDARGFRAMMDGAGLRMPSGHFDVAALETRFDDTMETADTLGVELVICPYLVAEDRPSDAGGWRTFGQRLAAIGEKVTASGRGFAWHNHDFEFQALAGGETPMGILLDAAPAMGWEADIAWIVRGDADPFEWIGRHGGRMASVHVKDIAETGKCKDEDGWADVGHGTLPWKDLLAAVKAASPGALWVMEHDKPSDALRFAERSILSVRAFEETLNA